MGRPGSEAAYAAAKDTTLQGEVVSGKALGKMFTAIFVRFFICIARWMNQYAKQQIMNRPHLHYTRTMLRGELASI
jgi:hypothetical protein